MNDTSVNKLVKAFTKKAAQVFGIRQKDVYVDHIGYGKFTLFVGMYGQYDFIMKDGSRKSELEFSQTDLSDIKNVRNITRSK